MEHTRIQKTLSRLCPECHGRLQIILRSEIIKGVEYSKSFVECENCTYQELYRDFTNKNATQIK
jgi:uncharacterized protein with PIN domain